MKSSYGITLASTGDLPSCAVLPGRKLVVREIVHVGVEFRRRTGGSVEFSSPGHVPKQAAIACVWLMLLNALASVTFGFESEVTVKPATIQTVLEASCVDCHNDETAEGGLNLISLSFKLSSRTVRERWTRIHDRIEQGEMPPDGDDLSQNDRDRLVATLSTALHTADLKDALASGRGPMRRLNRDEYQQNLRDVLALPTLDIRDILPEDREGHRFNKTTDTLDISRVQLTAYLDAAEAALLAAVASGATPRPSTTYRAVGRKLFSQTATFGNREAMFFARELKALDNEQLAETPDDETIEMALFRSAHWPYYGYPQGFVARLPGEYHVRFSARAVVQLPGFELKAATSPVPMTFRARKPSGADVSGDVRATGGLMDIQPERADYETTVHLLAGETFEYSLLGLPVPLARNVDGGPPTYRFPPFPDDGQPGVAFQSLEIEGPLSPETWPPPSHRVLFDELPLRAAQTGSELAVEVVSEKPRADARRLLHQFIDRTARQPVSDTTVRTFEELVFSRLNQGVPFAESMLAGYKAFLCSGHMLYLHEPVSEQQLRSVHGAEHNIHYAIASRLSHLLTNTRPDAQLMDRAREGHVCNIDLLHQETNRMIEGAGFERFVHNFTDYWLNLRHIHRDEPDVRLYPEYRFDAYLVESMERETREFFTAMVRENLPVSVLVDADFAFVNDRLAQHYQLPPVSGSALRKVQLPEDSPYGGLLTQAAILKVTANGTTTSPVVRGAWIMERLIGQPPPPPPASVPAVEPDIRGAKTIRDLLALHTKSESCAKCHARFDPVGLALENFDILGGWRTRYRSLEEGEKVTGIDRAGHDFGYTLSATVDASGALRDGRQFQNIRELKKLLSSDPRQLARNLLHQLTVYATGTPVRFSDRSEIEKTLDILAVNNYRTGDLLHALIQSRIFLGPASDETTP
jgi:mono/diheme cytochrome c family protein